MTASQMASIYRKEISLFTALKSSTLGIIGAGIPAFLFAFAQTKINSSTAGLLNSLTPIFAFTLGVLIFKNQFEKYKFFGVLSGFIGAALLILRSEQQSNIANGWALLIVIATLLYGMNVNLIKTYFSKEKPLVFSALSFVLIGPVALSYLFATNSFAQILGHPAAFSSMVAILILSLVGTVMATVLYYSLVVTTSPVFASSVTYLMPIVACIWGFVDGETIGLIHLFSFLLIILGILLIKEK